MSTCKYTKSKYYMHYDVGCQKGISVSDMMGGPPKRCTYCKKKVEVVSNKLGPHNRKPLNKPIKKELGDLVEYREGRWSRGMYKEFVKRGVILGNCKDFWVIRGHVDVNNTILTLREVKIIKKAYLTREQVMYIRGEYKMQVTRKKK